MANTFTEKVLNFLKEDRTAFKKVTTAIGQAIKQEVAENKKSGKPSFHILEGTVYRHDNGRYEFIPSNTMKEILEGDSLISPILVVEESRFLELLRLSMYELSEPQIQKEAKEKEDIEIAKAHEEAKKELNSKLDAEKKKKEEETW